MNRRTSPALRAWRVGTVGSSLIGILAIAVGGACRPQSESEPATTAATEGSATGAAADDSRAAEGTGSASAVGWPWPGLPPTTVIARRGDDEVTLRDVERTARRRALVEGVPVDRLVPPDLYQDSYFLWSMSDTILQERELLRLGERLRLLPDLDQLQIAWQEHPELGAYLDGSDLDELDAQLRTAIGLGIDAIYELLRAQLVHERWLERVVADLDERRLWDAFRWRHSTATVEAFGALNVPGDAEVAAFLADPPAPDFVVELYSEHRERFTIPESVDVTRVRGRRAGLETLREAAGPDADLDALAQAHASDGAEAAATRLTGQRRRQLPAAVFDLEVGSLSPILTDGDGFVLYRIESRHPQSRRRLDDVLRREIASTHLARETLTRRGETGCQAALAAMAAADAEALDAAVREHHLRRRDLGPIRRQDDDFLAGLGTAPELAEELFETLEVGQPASRCHLYDGFVWAVRLTDRARPTPSDFEAEREDFTAQYTQIIRSTAWDAYWAQATAEQPVRVDLPEGIATDKDAELGERE